MKFYGRTVDGQYHISNFETFEEYLNGLQEFEIRVIPTKDIRTLKMNNLYWWWLTLLSNECGHTPRELHKYFKSKLLCTTLLINGEETTDCLSTSDLSIKEFQLYLQNISRMSSEIFGFYLPDPDSLLKRS